MEKGYLNEVKAILKSLVLSCTDKMTIDKLNRDYRDVEGEFVPYRRLGFNNIEQFLRSIPDTIRVYGSGPTAMVCFVANERSDHIHDMIMEQKKPNRRRTRRPRSKGRSTPVRSNNNKFSNASQPRKPPGQQFSSFQSTNRSYMTKTLTVRDILPPQPVSSYPNHRPPCFDLPIVGTVYQLPQPAGIDSMNFGSKQSASHNAPRALPSLVRNPATDNIQVKDKIFKDPQEEVNKLSNRMTSSCRITSNPAAASQTQAPLNTVMPAVSISQTQSSPSSYRTVSFSPQLNITHPTKPSTSTLESTNNLNGIKPPNGGKTIKPKIKLSEDVERLLNMPSRSNLNPIQATPDSNAIDENLKNSPPKGEQGNNKKSNEGYKTFFDLSDDKTNDIDEAVPQFAANNLVYRLDFPEHTVNYGQKIPAYVLSDDVYVGAYLKIFIAEIHSPFKFWFHIQKDDNELDTLMYQIERFYKSLDANDLCIPIACLTPGQTCAACYNGFWHRAEIVAPPINNKIKVSFVDYGTVSEVDVKMVKLLASSFASLPKQALRGCLSHIKPRFYHWSHEATNYFLSLVLELMLYAKISEIDRKNQVLYMIICNTHGEEVININKSLVEQNFALINEDWQERKLKQNNGQRIHHPREDFPTFSMIESGEYPSFAELVNLQERGIDYEAIHDHIIFNKSAILNKHENAPEAIRNLSYFLMTTNPFRSDIIMELNGIKNTAAAKQQCKT